MIKYEHCLSYSLRHGNGFIYNKIKFINNKWVNELRSSFKYKITTSTPAYDINKNYLGKFKEDKFVDRVETNIMDRELHVVQIDYKFYLLPVGERSTQGCLQDISYLLNSSFKKKFDTGYKDKDLLNYYDNNHYTLKHTKNHQEQYRKLIEYNIIGNSISVQSRIGKKVFSDIDFKEYKKHRDLFIKENPKYESEILFLYMVNISIASLFWMRPIKHLMSKPFSKNKSIIDRLNLNINSKI